MWAVLRANMVNKDQVVTQIRTLIRLHMSGHASSPRDARAAFTQYDVQRYK